MSLLAGFRVVEIGDGLAAAVCGRLFADIGADVACIDPDNSTPLADYLNHGKRIIAGDPAEALSAADLIVCESRPQDLIIRGYDAVGLRRLNAKAALVFVSPFGQTGPRTNDPAMILLPWLRYSASGVDLSGSMQATSAPTSASTRPHTAAAKLSPISTKRNPASSDISQTAL